VGLSLVLCSCNEGVTQLIVAVNSDIQVPRGLSRIDVTASSYITGAFAPAEFPLAARDQGRSGAHELPLSFVVEPPSGDPSVDVTIEVLAYGPSSTEEGLFLFSRTMNTGFIEGKRLLLPVFLAVQCKTANCASNSTCKAGGECLTAEEPAADLKEIAPGEEENYVWPDPNRPPSTPEINIMPLYPSADQDVECVVSTVSIDPDMDDVSYHYTWRLDRLGDIPKAVLSSSISAAYIQSGDTLTCTVIASDGWSEGVPAQKSVTVQ